MPTYEYHCDKCETNFDVVQSFHDDPLSTCPTCGSPVRKVFGNVGIVFKGSGFYKTDSRNGGQRKESSSDKADASPSSPAEKSSGEQGAPNGKSSPDRSDAKQSDRSPAKAPVSSSPSEGSGSAAPASGDSTSKSSKNRS